MGSHVIRPPFTSGINRFQTHHIGSKGTDLFNQLIWIFKYLNKSVPFTHLVFFRKGSQHLR